MQLKVILSYLLGYVDIVVEGYYIERFINLCTSKSIYLWNLNRSKSTILYARISRKDFKRLRKVCRKTQCKVKIQKKNGFSFTLHKYKKRKIFACFLVVIILFILSLSNFVWNIDVTGNVTISVEDILKIANDNGLDKRKMET